MDSAEIDLKEIIAILKRQRRLIVVTIALIFGLAFAYILSATPIYRATTLVQIDAQGTNLLDPSAAEQRKLASTARLGNEPGGGQQNYLASWGMTRAVAVRVRRYGVAI